jgi:hypothetical protein
VTGLIGAKLAMTAQGIADAEFSSPFCDAEPVCWSERLRGVPK